MTRKCIYNIALTYDEINALAKAHDILGKLDTLLYPDDPDDDDYEFSFDRDEVSRYATAAAINMSAVMEILIGSKEWDDWKVVE